MMPKTCNEIIDETIAAYVKSNRAVTSSGHCSYIDPETGNQCAVGRCCEAPQDDWNGNWTTLRVSGRQLEVAEREALLKPEYRGKPAFFWMNLQFLHDDDGNWTASGLSKQGQTLVAELRRKWGE